MTEGSFWGAPRTARSVAIAVVDRLRGYTIEHAYDKAAMRSDYDAAESAIMHELDAANIPPKYSAVLQVQITTEPQHD